MDRIASRHGAEDTHGPCITIKLLRRVGDCYGPRGPDAAGSILLCGPGRDANVSAGQPDHTFLFADLAGFTALTEAHGDEQAADLVEEFATRVRAWMPLFGATDSKSVGDAMMVRCDAARGAVELSLLIAGKIAELPGFPEVRVGINTGSAVARDGDWFGSAVNIAARVSAAAGGGEVLLTDATLRAASPLGGVALEKLGPRRFRNVPEPVVIYRARQRRAREEEVSIDPVCRMVVDPAHAAGRLLSEEREYLFCSLECAQCFAANPERYVISPEESP